MLAPANDRLLRTIRRQPVDATPIWIMRQAGRYLPEYRKVREEAGSFIKLCKTPELACEVTLQPLRRYALDAAIIFSDILTIPDAFGLGLHFIEGEGPIFAKPIRTLSDIEQLPALDLNQLAYVYDAIQLVHQEIKTKLPLIGFTGSAWTLAAYMVEGKGKTQFPLLKQMQAQAPSLLHQLLKKLSTATIAHLGAQAAAGCQVLMIFDTWGGLLDDVSYPLFSLAYNKEVIKQVKMLHPQVPIILFTKGGSRWLESMLETGCDVVGLDWEIDLQEAKARVKNKVTLQGNLHPASLLASPQQLESQVQQLLTAYGKGSGHIFNLGHGITPDIDPAQVAVLVDAVHRLSKPFHHD